LMKWLLPGVGQERYKMNLEHFAVPESKVLIRWWECVKRTQVPEWIGSHWQNLGLFDYYNKYIIMNYNLLNKIGTSKFILRAKKKWMNEQNEWGKS
jgi:hypothetical protein